MGYTITTEQQLRNSFWENHPSFSRHEKIKNFSGNGTMYPTDVRVAWNDFVDMMSKDGQISRKLAHKTTLNA